MKIKVTNGDQTREFTSPLAACYHLVHQTGTATVTQGTNELKFDCDEDDPQKLFVLLGFSGSVFGGHIYRAIFERADCIYAAYILRSEPLVGDQLDYGDNPGDQPTYIAAFYICGINDRCLPLLVSSPYGGRWEEVSVADFLTEIYVEDHEKQIGYLENPVNSYWTEVRAD